MHAGDNGKAELEELKEKVPGAAVLEHLGFVLDRKESTRKPMKHRREGEIVIHDGWGRPETPPVSAPMQRDFRSNAATEWRDLSKTVMRINES